MNAVVNYLSATLGILGLCACYPLRAPQPVPVPQALVDSLKPSTIALEIALPLAPLNRAVADSLPREIIDTTINLPLTSRTVADVSVFFARLPLKVVPHAQPSDFETCVTGRTVTSGGNTGVIPTVLGWIFGGGQPTTSFQPDFRGVQYPSTYQWKLDASTGGFCAAFGAVETIANVGDVVLTDVQEVVDRLPSVPLGSGVNLKVEVRLDSLHLAMTGNTIAATATASLVAEADPYGGYGALNISLSRCGVGEPRPTVRVTVPIAVTLDSIANVHFKPGTVTHQFLVPCRVTALGLNVESLLSVAHFHERIDDALQKALGKLDRTVNLRSRYADAWASLDRPLTLRPDEQLSVRPIALKLQLPYGAEDSLYVPLSVIARPVVSVGDSAPSSPSPFPGVGVGIVPDSTRLWLEGSVTTSDANSRLSSEFDSAAFTTPLGEAVINRVRLIPLGDSGVAVGLRFKKPFRGWVFATGRLHVDTAPTPLVTITDFNYTLQTRNFLFSSVDWVLHTKLQEKIARRLRMPLQSRLDTAIARLNRHPVKLRNGFRLDITIARVKPIAAVMDSKRIVAIMEAAGVARLLVSDSLRRRP